MQSSENSAEIGTSTITKSHDFRFISPDNHLNRGDRIFRLLIICLERLADLFPYFLPE